MRIHKDKLIRGEISTLIVMGFLAIMAVATIVTTTLNQEVQDQRASASEAVACNYDSGQDVPLGETETDENNSENRVPIKGNEYYYDSLKDESKFTEVKDKDIFNLNTKPSGNVDQNVKNIMSNMFGYKPSRLSRAYILTQANSQPEGGPSKAHVLRVPVEPSSEIKMFSAGSYNIGGGFVAMVTFADIDRITLHIGRHEYFTGTKKCANGQTCSGGYWIYVKNICVDKRILDAYKKAEPKQLEARANLDPIDLPMIKPGHILGKTKSDSVLVAVRDNGSFISLYNDFYWGGAEVRDMKIQPDSLAKNTLTPTSITPASANTVTPIPTPRPKEGTIIDVGITPPSIGISTPTQTLTPIDTICNDAPKIDSATFKVDDNNKISFFRVNMSGNGVNDGKKDEFGPKVAEANDQGVKIKNGHIAGPSIGNKQWEQGEFSTIELKENSSKKFYIEIMSESGIYPCSEMVVACKREKQNANTEIACDNSQATAFTTTDDINTAGIVNNATAEVFIQFQM